MTYVKASKSHFVLGSAIQYSVYNQAGDLLLRKGKVITTNSQIKILIAKGFILEAELKKVRVTSNVAQKPKVHRKKQNIFEIKNQWLTDLYTLLIGNRESNNAYFTHKILTIALDIQLQAKVQHDALLASLQIDFENHYGLVHALHCAVNCEMIGIEMRLGQVERLMIVAAALTHDIGIIVEQEELHRQKTKLTDEQWQGVKKHTTSGVAILQELGVNDAIWLDAVRCHHERLDGSGYLGIKGDDISVGARILAVADSYAAMVHPTEFRKANSGKRALNELYKGRESLYDPKIVKSFIIDIGIYPPGSLVRLVNKEIGVVVKPGKLKHKPDVCALISPKDSIYANPVTRQTTKASFEIVSDEPLSKHYILIEQIEKLWGKNKY